jgi:hypothetical protein
MQNLKSFAFGLYIESTRLSLRRLRRHRRRCARAAAAVGVGGDRVTPPPPPTSASAAAAALPRSRCSGRRWRRFHRRRRRDFAAGAQVWPLRHCPALRLVDGCPVAPLQSNTCVLLHCNRKFEILQPGGAHNFMGKVYTRYIPGIEWRFI